MKLKDLTTAEFEDRAGYFRSVIFNQDQLGTNTKVQLMRLAPGQQIKPHYHKQRSEVFMIIKGAGQIIVDGVEASSSYSVVLCEPGDIHSVINLSDTDNFEWLAIKTNDSGDKDIFWVEEDH